MQSEKDKIMELLTVTEVKEGGEVTFTDRSIEILQELGQQYKETPLFKKSRQDNPDWEGGCQRRFIIRVYVRKIDGSNKQNTYNYGLQVNDSFNLGEVGAGVTGNGSSSR